MTIKDGYQPLPTGKKIKDPPSFLEEIDSENQTCEQAKIVVCKDCIWKICNIEPPFGVYIIKSKELK